MGLSLEFYAGDAKLIGQAFSGFDFEQLRNGSLAHSYADFSLHISPLDLNVLSEQAAGLLGRPPVLLLKSLERHVGGSPEESSADAVSRAWVELFAAVPAESASRLSSIWLSAVMAKSREEIDTGSPDAARAVEALLSLCREALARRTDVVFVWYL